MPYPIANLTGNIASQAIRLTPTVDRPAGVGFYAPSGEFVIPSRDLIAGLPGSAMASGRFRCRKNNAADAFAVGDLLSFESNGVVAGSEPLRVSEVSASGAAYVFAVIDEENDGDSSGGEAGTFGALSVTDSATGRMEGDHHTVNTGVMMGAEFKLTSGTWVYVANSKATIEVDSTSPDWPISAADVATITGKMSAGQEYFFNAVDYVNDKYATVEVRESGAIRLHDLDASSAAAPGLNAASTIDAAGLGATETLDCQNGKQLSFEFENVMPQDVEFTISNLPDQQSMRMLFVSAQGARRPTIAGGTTKKYGTDVLYTTSVIVVVTKVNSRLEWFELAAQ